MTRPIARVSKALAVAAAAVLLLLVLTALLLSTAPGERFARGAIERTASARTGAVVTIGSIELRPWRLAARLDAIAVRRESAAAELVYAVEAATARARIAGARLHLELDSPVLTLVLEREPGGDAGASVPSIGERLEGARLASLTADSGVVRLLDGAGAEVARLDSVSLALARSGARRFEVRGGGDLRVRAGGERWLEAGALGVEGEIAGAELHLERAHLEREGADLTARGTLRDSSGRDGALEADFRIAADVVRELFPELRATGEIDGTARATLATDGLRIEADFRGAGLHWDALGPFAAGGRVTVADRRIELGGGSLAGYGGRADVSAAWDLAEDRQRLAIEWEGVEMGGLAEDLGLPFPAADARASGEAQLESRGFALAATTGSGAARVAGRTHRGGVPLEASARASLDAGSIDVTEGRLELSAGRLDAAGRVTTDGAVGGAYRLDWRDLGRLAEGAAILDLPAPPVDLAGSVSAQGGVTGTLGDPQWTARAEPQDVTVAGIPVTIEAEAAGDLRSLELGGLTADAGGGRIRLEGAVNWSGETELDLQLEVDAVDLCALLEREIAPACGVLHARGTATGTLAMPRWSLLGEVTDLRSRAGGVTTGAPGLLRFSARQDDGRVVVDELRAILDGGAIEAVGTYDLATRQVTGSARASGVPLATLLPAGDSWRALAGTVGLDASFEGPLDAPRGQAQVRLGRLTIDDRPLPDLVAELTADGRGDLAVAAGTEGGSSFLTGRLALERPWALQADVDLAAIPGGAVVNLLGNLPDRLQDPVLAGRVAIDAVLEAPVELHVRGEIERLEARYGRLRFAADPFSVAGDREGLRVEELRVRTDGLALLVSGTAPLGAGRELDLRARGDLPLELLASSDLVLNGVASLDVAVSGLWRSPRLAGRVSVARSSGRFRDVDWHSVALEARLVERQIFLDSVTGSILGGQLSGHGELRIEEPIESSDVELVLDLRGADVLRLAGDLPSAARPYLLLDAGATLAADRLDPEALSGRIDLHSVRAGAGGNEMVSEGPARVLIEGGRATLSALHLTGGGTDLRLQGSTSIADPLRDLEARAAGALDFAQVGFLTASLPGLEIGGLGNLDLRLRHGSGGIELEGGGTLARGRIASTSPRFVVADIAGEVAFRGSSIRLRDLRGNLGGGTVAARAAIDLADLARLESVVLEAEATGVNLSFGEGVRARFTGDAVFQGRGDRYRLKGDLRVLSGLFTREIDAATSESEFLAGIRAELAEAETAPFAETVELAVRLATEGDVYVDNALARVAAGGNLRLEGTMAQPETTGVVTNTADGILRLGRNVFNLELARITLVSYPLEPASIEVAATTEVAGHTVRLELEGTPDDVVTRLTSTDPDLTQGDLAALLTTGRTAEGVTDGTSAMLEARAAVYLGELFQEQLGLGLVFDTPASLPVLSSETGPEDRFTVGRRLTDDVTVAYSAGVEDDSSLWIIDYQPLRRLWFRAIEENGEAFTFEVAQRLTLDLGARARAQPPDPTRIRSVELVAADPARPLPPIERRLRLAPGQRYDYWRAEDAAEDVRREISRLGYLGARVEVEAVVAGDREVALRLVADPGPRVSFQWTGDDPGKDLRGRIERGWDGQLPPGLLVAELAARATHELRADRWYLARVFGTVSDQDAALTVELEVRLATRGKGVDIDFSGNAALADEALAAALPRTDSPRFFTWIAEDPGRIEDAVALRYAEEGFLDVRIGAIESAFDELSGRLRVQIPVEEGLPYTVESIAFPGADSLPRQALEAALPVAVGEPFALSSYREAGRALRRLYREHGYPDAGVRSRVRRREPGSLDLVLTVEEGDPAVIGTIEIAGSTRTREELIRSRLGIESGAPLRVDQLAAAERRLYQLGVFRSVEVVARDPLPGTRTRDITVRVIEKPDLAFDYGLRYRTDDVENLQPTVDEVKTKGLEAVVRTQLLQPFRSADSMILSLFVGEERQRARLGYQIPLFFGRQLPTEVSIETGRETRERFDIEIRSRSSQLTLQQRKTLGERTRLLYGVQLLRGRIDSVAGPQAEIPSRRGDWADHNRFTVSMVHDRRVGVMNPKGGSLLSGSLQAGSPAIGADTEFARANGQWSLFVPLGKSPRAPVWASSYRAGAIWSGDPFADPFLDLEDRFTAGGPYSVRGFEANTLGPRFPAENGFPIGGRGVLIFNQELRFPIWDDLWGGVFYDAGNVFAQPEDMSFGGLRKSYGIGLRYDIGFGVLRADVARVVDRQPGEAKERLHFSFGHAF